LCDSAQAAYDAAAKAYEPYSAATTDKRDSESQRLLKLTQQDEKTKSSDMIIDLSSSSPTSTKYSTEGSRLSGEAT